MGRPKKSSQITQLEHQPSRVRRESYQASNIAPYPGYVQDSQIFTHETQNHHGAPLARLPTSNMTPHFNHLLGAVELAAQDMTDTSTLTNANGTFHTSQSSHHHQPVIDPLLEDIGENRSGVLNHTSFDNHTQLPPQPVQVPQTDDSVRMTSISFPPHPPMQNDRSCFEMPTARPQAQGSFGKGSDSG